MQNTLNILKQTQVQLNVIHGNLKPANAYDNDQSMLLALILVIIADEYTEMNEGSSSPSICMWPLYLKNA